MCCCVGFLYIGQNIHWSSVLCCSELRYFVLLYLCINTHLVGTTLLCCALWCHVVLYSTLSCFDVLCSLDARYIPGQNHITRLCSSSTAAIQTRAAYCCRHPAGPATSSPLPCPCPCLTNSAFPQISPDFNPNLAELTDQYWFFKKRLRTGSRYHLCAVEMRRTIKRGDLGRLIEFTVFPDCQSWEHLSFLCTSIEIPLGSC